MMNNRLAVCAPFLGLPSETFIHKHMELLKPGGSVVVVDHRAKDAIWNVSQPCLVLNETRLGAADYAGAFLRTFDPRSLKHQEIQRRKNRRVLLDFLRAHGVKAAMGEYLDFSVNLVDQVQEAGIPFYAHAHGADVFSKLVDPKFAEQFKPLRSAAGIIAVSHYMRDRIVGLGYAPARVHVAPCGVDVPKDFIERPAGERIRCLAVGRMVAKKAPIITLDAFRRAAEAIPNLTLEYVGGGPLLTAVRHYIQAMELEAKVTLLDRQPHDAIKRLLRETDIFLQHSIRDPETGDMEGMPVSVMEAMAHGLPVVTTIHSGIPEIIRSGENGLLVAELDVRGMAAHIIDLARDADRRRRLGEQAHRTAVAELSWDIERNRLLNIMKI